MKRATAYSIMVDLAACLLNEITDRELPMPCTVAVMPGESVVPEYQGPCTNKKHVCGLGWVRMMTGYPATGVGVRNANTGNCNSTLGLDLNMGITRCITLPTDPRTTMRTAELEALAKSTADDMEAMRAAIVCCANQPGKDLLLGAYSPIGPAGGMVGGSWSMSVVV